MNRLYYGDNLSVLRDKTAFPDDSVDLVYADPPFSSSRAYNVLFQHRETKPELNAQIVAFDDTWTWSQDDDDALRQLKLTAPTPVVDALTGLHKLLGPCDILSYLVMMTERVLELRRVMKPTASLWLHCDPVASHYLKLLCDAIFGPTNFRNEIIWQRTGAKALATIRLPSNHDVILCYGKTDKAKWNGDKAFIPYDLSNLDPKTAKKYSNVDEYGRRYELKDLTNPNPNRPNLTYEFLGVTKVWRWTQDRMQSAYDAGLIVQSAPGKVPRYKKFLDENRGKPLGDVWSDIPPVNSQAAERLGYPTQKPLALLERIISLATDAGDLVLDPFVGGGTTVDAAQRLGRSWVGIDVTYLAIAMVEHRFEGSFGSDFAKTYKVAGIPRDLESAKALFNRDPFEFERWVVDQVDGHPNAKQVGDRGCDGVIRFWHDRDDLGEVAISVKGGTQIAPAMTRELEGTVNRRRSEMGLLILMGDPTRGMVKDVNESGSYVHPLTGQSYPRLQIITVSDILAGRRPKMPTPENPLKAAQRYQQPPETLPGI